MKRAAISFTLVLILIASVFALPIRQDRFGVAGLNEQETVVFFASFKEAVAKGEKRAVAGMLSYPIRVTVKSGRRMKLINAAAFIRAYDQIFYDEFKQLIAETEADDLWAKSAGVATPRGEVWIAGIVKNSKNLDKYEIKIIAINGPIRP
jgi:hypothetical protein